VPGMPADLEGESPSLNLVEVKGSEAQGCHREVGREEAWNKATSRRTETG